MTMSKIARIILAMTKTSDKTRERMASSLLASITRDPNPQAYWKGATVSESGNALLVDTPSGQTFVAHVREPDEDMEAAADRLAAAMIQLREDWDFEPVTPRGFRSFALELIRRGDVLA